MTEQIPPQQPQHNPGGYPPPYWQPMPPQDEDEINLLDLLLVIAKRKRMILGFSFSVAVVVAAITLLIPNTYRTEVLVAPAQNEDVNSSSLSALGGLASLAGVSIGGGSGVEENLAVIQSREFLWLFVQENNLLPNLFESEWDAENKRWEEDDPTEQPGPFDVYRLMIDEKTLSITQDDNGLVRIAINWTDAALAEKWANALVARANKYLADEAIARSKSNLKYLNQQLNETRIEELRNTLFELIASEQKNAMLANSQKDFAFRVIDPAMMPDEKIKPKRSIIVILAAFTAFFMALGWAFISEGIERARQHPKQEEVIQKIREALRLKG